MAGSIKRSVAGGLTYTALVISLVMTGGVTAMAATVTTVPWAEPGDVIEVSGSIDLLDLERTVTFHWDDADGPRIGRVGPLLLTTYETTVTIPTTAPAGEHLIYACNDSCGSTRIMIVVPTTTTLPPTTLPMTTTSSTTTTLPPTTVVSTTTTPTTTTDGSGTTTDPSPTSASAESRVTTTPTSTSSTTGPSASGSTGPDAEAATIRNPSDLGDADSAGPSDEEASTDQDTSSDEPEVQSLGLTQRRYIPPTTSATSSATSSAAASAAETDDSGFEVVVAAGDDDDGWYSGSPLVFWSVWLLVVLAATGAAGVVARLADRGGRSRR